MRRDPHIRSYADRAPLMPQALPGRRVRFGWPDPHDADVRRIREDMQEEGRGLYVLRDPFDPFSKALVEAYYPDQLSTFYANRRLDPIRLTEVGLGRLVVVGDDLAPGKRPLRWRGEINPLVIDSLRAGNRNARQDLKRKIHAPYQEQALRNEEDKRSDQVINEWADFYRERWAQTVRYCLTPHTGAANKSVATLL